MKESLEHLRNECGFSVQIEGTYADVVSNYLEEADPDQPVGWHLTLKASVSLCRLMSQRMVRVDWHCMMFTPLSVSLEGKQHCRQGERLQESRAEGWGPTPGHSNDNKEGG